VITCRQGILSGSILPHSYDLKNMAGRAEVPQHNNPIMYVNAAGVANNVANTAKWCTKRHSKGREF
jgi:hypothetical protein